MCSNSNGVNVCLGKQGEMTDRQSRQTNTADSVQHNGQLLLALLTDNTTARSYSRNPSLGLQNSLTNSWNCNCANCCINTVNIFKDLKSVTAKYGFDMKSKAVRAAPFVVAAAKQSHTVHGWYSQGKKKKKSRSKTHARTYTLHGLRIAAKWSQLWLHPTAV